MVAALRKKRTKKIHLAAFWDHISYQGLVVLMFPMSKSGSLPSKFDRDTEKPLFLEPQSLMDSSKSFCTQTHFHLASTFSDRGNG